MPGFVAAGGMAEGTDMLGNLDLSFFSWDVLAPFVIKGFYFSIWLTVVATVGGIVLRHRAGADAPVGQEVRWSCPAAAYVNTMRSIPLVMVLLWFFLLIPFAIGRPIGAEMSAVITFIAFEAAYFSRDHARRHPVDPARAGATPATRWA